MHLMLERIYFNQSNVEYFVANTQLILKNSKYSPYLNLTNCNPSKNYSNKLMRICFHILKLNYRCAVYHFIILFEFIINHNEERISNFAFSWNRILLNIIQLSAFVNVHCTCFYIDDLHLLLNFHLNSTEIPIEWNFIPLIFHRNAWISFNVCPDSSDVCFVRYLSYLKWENFSNQ